MTVYGDKTCNAENKNVNITRKESICEYYIKPLKIMFKKKKKSKENLLYKYIGTWCLLKM